MKRYLIALAFTIGIAALISTQSAQFPIATSIDTLEYTNTGSLSGTNYELIVATNEIESVRFHTFQSTIVSTSNVTLGLDRSLNGVNWVIVGTNSFTDPGSTGDQTMEGKWRYARLRLYGTNVTATIRYLGGR